MLFNLTEWHKLNNCSRLNVAKTNKQPAEKWYKTPIRHCSTLVRSPLQPESLFNQSNHLKKNGLLKNAETISYYFRCPTHLRTPCARSIQFAKESIAIQLNAHRIYYNLLGIVHFVGAVLPVLQGKNIRGILRNGTVFGRFHNTHCVLFYAIVAEERIGRTIHWLGWNHWNKYDLIFESGN